MSDEENAKEVIDFPLVPVRAVIERGYRWDGRRLIRIRLYPYPTVVPDGQEVINDFEPLGSGRVIDGGDIDDHGVFGRGVVFEKGDDGNDAQGGNVDAEFVFPYGELLDVFGEAGEEVLPVCVEGDGFLGILVCGIDDGGVEFTASYGGRKRKAQQGKFSKTNGRQEKSLRGRCAWRILGVFSWDATSLDRSVVDLNWRTAG